MPGLAGQTCWFGERSGMNLKGSENTSSSRFADESQAVTNDPA